MANFNSRKKKVASSRTKRKEKKIWFRAITHNLCIPITIEGWVSMSVFLYWAFSLMLRTPDEPISITKHWPELIELIVLLIVSYFFFRGRIEK